MCKMRGCGHISNRLLGSLSTSLLFFFSFRRHCPQKRTKCGRSCCHVSLVMRFMCDMSWGSCVISHEIATLVHPIEPLKLKSSRARKGHPLDFVSWSTSTAINPINRGATVPRERSYTYKQLASNEALHHKADSCRFRVLGYVRESALPTGQREISWCNALSATSHGLGMTLGMTLVNPVQSGAAIRRKWLTPCACPLLCSCQSFGPRFVQYTGIF